MEQDIIKIKREIIYNLDAIVEENIFKQERDIPEYVNVNAYSKFKVETEALGDFQEIYQCSQCPSKYKKFEYLSIHEALHDPQRFCPICYETFTCKKKLGHHLNQHIRDKVKEDRKLAYTCSYCEKIFDTKKKFILHERVHTNERPHKCEICGEGFKQSGTLKDHYVTHTKEKRFVCEVCNGSFTTSSSLKRHKKKIHDKGKTINCKHCDFKFLNMTDFRNHLKEVHPDAGYKRTCPLCSEIFHTRCTYRKHKQFHEDQLPKDKQLFSRCYLCVLCGDKSLTLKLYLDHRRIHLNYSKAELEEAAKNNLFKCKSCPKEFVIKSALFKHMDVHMEKKFKCEPCQNFYSYYGLNAHMRTSHQMLHCRVCREVLRGRAKLYYHYQKCHPTVQKRFACSICGKQYVAKNQLNIHFKLIHEKNAVKSFKCNICGKRFLTRLIMAAHVTHVHNRKTKYKCSFCEVVFNTRKEILTHSLIHKDSKIEEKYSLQPNGKTRRQFQCKICKKIFQSLKNCKKHLTFKMCRNFSERRKRKSTPQNNNCSVCSKKYATEDTLRRHMVYHSISYNCRICDKKYKMLKTMKRHVQLHHPGEKAFRCDMCAAEFDRSHDYHKHRNMHKVELDPVIEIESYAENFTNLSDTFLNTKYVRIKEETGDITAENLKYELP